jgi:hypothetical protein
MIVRLAYWALDLRVVLGFPAGAATNTSGRIGDTADR